MPKKEVSVHKKPKEAELVSMIKELKKLNEEIAKIGGLYGQRDAIVEKIMGIAVTMDQDYFLIQREIKVGKTKIKIDPGIFDAKKAKLVAKNWKSVACPTVTIE